MVRLHNITMTILRWVLGAVFLFSGAMKCLDPVGTAIYVEKYLATYSLSVFAAASEAIAVSLIVVECAVGLLIILGVWRKGVSLLSSIMLLVFTIITLLSATLLPIGDCGCFGDAVKLTPWQTLFKNLALLPISIYIWRKSEGSYRPIMRDLIYTVVAMFIPLGVSLYALATMPLVDFLPYKVGTNLREGVVQERQLIEESTRTVLRFRDTISGAIVELDAMATECWSDESLEFVESATIMETVGDTQYDDFVLYNADGGDVTIEVLSCKGRIALLCINDAAALDDSATEAIHHLYSLYPASAIYVVSATALESGLDSEHLLVDAMTLRSIIRADVGIVVLRDGVIEYKDSI